jgi:hypothetical protein
MADDAVKKAVGYGFDASLRKGTMAGYAAMRGSSEYLALDSKGKDAADNLFKDRIQNDKNLKSVKGIGDEKVSVYRKAAKEVPSRAIDYDKEFNKPKRKKLPTLKVEQTPAPKKAMSNKDMGFRPFAKADKPKPKPPRASGSGISQMLNITTLGGQYKKK